MRNLQKDGVYCVLINAKSNYNPPSMCANTHKAQTHIQVHVHTDEFGSSKRFSHIKEKQT